MPQEPNDEPGSELPASRREQLTPNAAAKKKPKRKAAPKNQIQLIDIANEKP